MKLFFSVFPLAALALTPLPVSSQVNENRAVDAPADATAAEVDALASKGRELLEAGDYEAAEPVIRQTLALREKSLGAEHPDTLASLDDLASLLYYLGHYDDAILAFLRVLEARERALGLEHSYTLTSVNNLAVLYFSQGRYDEAEPLYARAFEARERILGPEHPETLESVNNLAALYESQGRYGEAELLLARALEASERIMGSEHPDTLLWVNNLAAVYSSQGRYGEAEPLYARALEARERILGPEHPSTLISVANLANLYENQGRYGEAEPLLAPALEASERILGPEHPDTLLWVNNLASLYESQGRYGEAEPLYARALEARERNLGPEHPDTLISVNNLASFYENQGRYGEAEPLYARALEALERILGPEHPSTLISVANLAGLYKNQGRYDVAEPLYVRALAGRINVLPEFHPDLARSFKAIAELITAKQGSPQKSAYFRKRAVNSLQGVRQNMAKLDPATQRSFLDKHRNTYLSLQEALVTQGRFAEAEQVGRMLKDVEYTAFVRGAADGAEGEQLAMTRQERAWDAQLTQWLETPNEIAGQLAALRSKKSKAGELSDLEQKQFADLDDAYGQAYEKYFALVTQWTSDTQIFESKMVEREVEALELEKSRAIQRLVGRIGPDVALLQAVAFEGGLHLFFVTGDALVHEEVSVSRSELFETIFDARRVIDEGRDPGIAMSEFRGEEIHTPLGLLYQWLIAPIEDELAAAGTTTLMLNLQGQIRYLPFAALWDGEAYLTEKLELALYTPAADTRYDAPAALTGAQGFGLSKSVSGFSPLPGVPLELEYIIGTDERPGVLQGEYLLDEGFTRASFEEGLSNPEPVVHLATHFEIRPGDEASSYLLLGDGSRVSIAAINRSYKYNFDGVELLTLSACETAVGAESTGMEIEGFGALAQNKGAASVVASLWQVSDAAAPRLMRTFYQGLVDSDLSKARALQNAQREMISSDDFKDPFYWAPFVIMGNWR